MGLNDTVSAERIQIGFFGARNAGKSSLVNAVTGQDLSVVSDVKGTTTDPVKKAMELLPLGPVVIIDTPGMDDEGSLGEMRVKKAQRILSSVDIAVLVADAATGLNDIDRTLISLFKQKALPYVIAFNKCDLLPSLPEAAANTLYVSATEKYQINELKELIAHLSKNAENSRKLVSDLISPEDLIVLVIPIDSAAPKGRLILPQQQTMRDILDSGATVVACRDTELPQTLASLNKKPRLVITDSQAFGKVNKLTPADIPLTSFSILFARYKGDLEQVVRGAAQLDHLQDGDCILISEGCTHHRQCNDIGTVKLPGWIKIYTGKDLHFSFTSGGDFPEDLSEYALVIHCGGCMLNEREMKRRLHTAADSTVPMTNYGVAIAQMHGILKRSLESFPSIANLLD